MICRLCLNSGVNVQDNERWVLFVTLRICDQFWAQFSRYLAVLSVAAHWGFLVRRFTGFHLSPQKSTPCEKQKGLLFFFALCLPAIRAGAPGSKGMMGKLMVRAHISINAAHQLADLTLALKMGLLDPH